MHCAATRAVDPAPGRPGHAGLKSLNRTYLAHKAFYDKILKQTDLAKAKGRGQGVGAADLGLPGQSGFAGRHLQRLVHRHADAGLEWRQV